MKDRECGLQKAYEGVVPFDDDIFRAVRLYVNRLKGIAMLPSELILPFFQRNLQQVSKFDVNKVHSIYHLLQPPQIGHESVDRGLTRLAQYYGNSWATPERVTLISQYDNPGPRTTNHAEGYNNSLRSKFSVSELHQNFERDVTLSILIPF